MSAQPALSDAFYDDADQRWRAASIAAARAKRDYETAIAAPDADERSTSLLWLKLWRAERARDALLAD